MWVETWRYYSRVRKRRSGRYYRRRADKTRRTMPRANSNCSRFSARMKCSSQKAECQKNRAAAQRKKQRNKAKMRVLREGRRKRKTTGIIHRQHSTQGHAGRPRSGRQRHNVTRADGTEARTCSDTVTHAQEAGTARDQGHKADSPHTWRAAKRRHVLHIQAARIGACQCCPALATWGPCVP